MRYAIIALNGKSHLTGKMMANGSELEQIAAKFEGYNAMFLLLAAAGIPDPKKLGKDLMKESTPQWTEYEIQSVDEWIARQDVLHWTARGRPPPG
jgi:hypothetical protein